MPAAAASPLRHILLFGSGNYDYRNLAGGGREGRPMHVPPYQGYHREKVVATDDFYAWLDSGETEFSEQGRDLSVGRVPCGALKGTVEGGSGSGSVSLRILAGPESKVNDLPGDLHTQYAGKRGPILFERTVPYRNDRFSADFFIPARIPFGDSAGRLLRLDLTLDSSIQALAAWNIPNPVKRNGTVFHFASLLPSPDTFVPEGEDPPGERVDFTVRIHDQTGRVVKVPTKWLIPEGSQRPAFRTVATKRNTLVISR